MIVSDDFFFFFNDTATTEIYTLSLHDALPISPGGATEEKGGQVLAAVGWRGGQAENRNGTPQSPNNGLYFSEKGKDRKSTRLNSSHANISYAVFCLKKKNKKITKLIM